MSVVMATAKTKKNGNGTVQLNANVPSELKKSIQKMAVDQDVSMSDLVAQILQSYVVLSKSADGKQAS